MPSYKNKTTFEFLLLVRKNGNIKSIEDLKGKVLAIPNNYDPVASRIWFEMTFAKNGIKDVDKYFKQIRATPKESQIILDLFFGKIDVCLVRKSTLELVSELNPQVGQSLSPLLTSPAFPVAVICFTPNFKNEYHKKVFIEQSLEIHKTETGKQFTTLMKIEKLVPFRDEYMDNYYQLIKDYKKYVPLKRRLLFDKI